MSEYCPNCGHTVQPEVGMGSSCTHCDWSGLVASTDPRRDTRNDEEPTTPPTPRVDSAARARVIGRIRVSGW